PGRGTGPRMAPPDQAVQLPQQREGRAVFHALGLGAHAGDRQATARLEPHLAERLLHEARGLELLEAQLGLAADALAHPDDALAVTIDGCADGLLEALFGRHGDLL